MTLEFLGLFLLLAGFVVGLGAVTVIDIHGFLGRRSNYWTEATTRTHKVTKPLIWLGTTLAIVGGLIYFRLNPTTWQVVYLMLIAPVLILNGCFLTFSVSPHLLNKEKEGRANEILSDVWQKKITMSFIISFLGWWGSLLLVVSTLV